MRETEILKGLEGGENMAVQFVDNLLSLGLPVCCCDRILKSLFDSCWAVKNDIVKFTF